MADLRIVDLSPYYEGGESGRAHVAAEVDRACRELGFFAVVGHRVPSGLISTTRETVRGFFDLPVEAKLAVRTERRDSGRGYVPLEGENLSFTTTFASPPDLKESYSIGPLEPGDDPYHRFEPSGIAFSPNVWPTEPGTFEPAMRAYYHAVGALAADLLALTALAFGLPDDWFDAKNDRPTSALRVLHYPPRPQLGARQFPASPHTDYGTWTILHKRPGPTGLEAQALDGTWVPVQAPEGGFVVNVGDLLMRWTGGHWLSTLHRVMPIEGGDPEGELSMAFFHQPNWDVVVYPFTTDVVRPPQVAQRYAADALEQHYYGVTAGELVFGKYRASVSDDALEGSRAGRG